MHEQLTLMSCIWQRTDKQSQRYAPFRTPVLASTDQGSHYTSVSLPNHVSCHPPPWRSTTPTSIVILKTF